MFVHGFLIRWKQEVSAEQVQQTVDELKAFKGVIAGLCEVYAGPNISDRSKGYTFACVMFFESEQSVADYFPHPQHQAFVAKVAPLAEAVDFDFNPA